MPIRLAAIRQAYDALLMPRTRCCPTGRLQHTCDRYHGRLAELAVSQLAKEF
jgi:hypothetical protein